MTYTDLTVQANPPQTNGDAALDFVTVVYEVEQPLLELQARSLARHLRPGTARRLVVIDNSRPRMRRRAVLKLIGNYGPLASSVEIITPETLGIASDTWGDRGQQVLKLAVADWLDTGRYVVLDSKNHLIAPLDRDWLVASDGRPRIRLHSYVGHPRERGLRAVLAYFNLDESLIGCFAASTTPFTMDTVSVRALMRSLEAQTSKDFATGFLETGMTEFPLYVGWLLSQGGTLADYYAIDDITMPIVWPHLANRVDVYKAIEAAGEATPFFSTHRDALAVIDPAGAEAVAGLWAGRGILPDRATGQAFITAFRQHYRRAKLRRKLRRAPAKALRLIRTPARTNRR